MNHKKTIHTDAITQTIVDLIFQCSFTFPPEMTELLRDMRNCEELEIARGSLDILSRNAEIAAEERIPLCQDCGIVTVFLEIGQDALIEGIPLVEAVNGAVAQAYAEFYLRKSVVGDPLRRLNTGTNTPCFIHTDIVAGDTVKVTVYLKGGGSENMGALKMFRPTSGIDEILQFIENHVIEAGPNPCPPLFLGIGIGGTADAAVLNSKKAVLRGIGSIHPDPAYADLEAKIKARLNKTGVGPLGFGGISTVAAVYIKEAPTHIATLPVALNLNCHSLRYGEALL